MFQYGLKSERRKKRLRKWGREKKLRSEDARRLELYKRESNLGYIELEKPIESGWVRYFVLRKDVAQSKEVMFFQKILGRINTKKLCNRKDFLKKNRKTKKLTSIEQHTKRLSMDEFRKCGFTEREKEFFEYKVLRRPNGDKYRAHVFLEDWRFEFKVKRHYITHSKVHDNVLEQQIAEQEKIVMGWKETGVLNKVYGRGKYHGYSEREKVLKKDQDRSLKEFLLERNLRMPLK